MKRRIAIISYGTGNLLSLRDALQTVGAVCKVAKTASELSNADALVLPGIGHFHQAMNFLKQSGLLKPTLERINDGIPTLGVCLGFQLLTQSSEEALNETGLGLLPCSTIRIKPSDSKIFKVPQLGWNKIYRKQGQSVLLSGISDEDLSFYYANSYAVCSSLEQSTPFATYQHSSEYLALIENRSLFGVQFHPEKSRHQGLHLLENFMNV
jgi:glutamine amidotransferase